MIQMRNCSRIMLMVAFVTLFGGQAFAAEGKGVFVAELPEFTLKDPDGTEHTNDEFKGKAVVVLISIPNVKHGDLQKRWSSKLKKKGFPENVNFVLIQDMKQSNVKEKARSSMKKKFKPDSKPVLLLDETSEVRKKFLVPQDETAVLIFDKEGKLAYNYTGKPTIKGVRALKKILEKM